MNEVRRYKNNGREIGTEGCGILYQSEIEQFDYGLPRITIVAEDT